VDRFEDRLTEVIAESIDEASENPFHGADELWNSFQNKIRSFVNNREGSAIKNSAIKKRADWNKIKKILKAELQMSALQKCN